MNIGMHHGHDPHGPDPFHLFMTGLSGLGADEIRKAKILYLRNSISEYRAAEAALQILQGGWMWKLFDWPQAKLAKLALKAQADRIHNALQVWSDDLKGERFDFP